MKHATIIGLASVAAIALTGCTQANRANRDTTFSDKPADITCWSYGTETFSGKSTGKVEDRREGRVRFVDAANGRYTTIDGECRIVYAK